MSIIDDLIRQAQESREKSNAQSNPFLNGYKANEQKVWTDRRGNVNVTDLGTGVTRRSYDAGRVEDVLGLRNINPNKEASVDSFGADFGQQAMGRLHGQNASYKSGLASLGLSAAGLLHGDNNYKPEVGSWLWKMTEGAEAESGVSNRMLEDSKLGKGWLHGLTMDLAGGAIDLAGDRVLDLVAPGAGLIAMDVRNFGASAESSREQGKSISTQMLNGAIHAAIGHFAEKAGTTVGRGKGTAAWGERLSSAIESRLEQKGASKLVQKLVIGFGEEAAEEMLEDILNPAVSKFAAGIDKGDYDAEEFPSIAEIAYDGLVGGLLGLMGGFTEGVRATKEANASGVNAENDVPVREPGEANETFANRVKTYLKAKAAEHVDTALERASNAKHNAEPAEAPTTPVEAQMPSTPTEIAPTIPNEVKQEAGEFNAKPEAEAQPAPAVEPSTTQPERATIEPEKTKPIGPKTAEKMAGSKFLADMAQQRAERANAQGVDADASDFIDNFEANTNKAEEKISTTPTESGKIEPAEAPKVEEKAAKVEAKTGAETLAEAAKTNEKKSEARAESESEPLTAKAAEEKVRESSRKAIERKLGKKVDRARTTLLKSKTSDRQIGQRRDSRQPKDVTIKLSGDALTHNTVRGDEATASVTNTAFKNKLKKLFGNKQVVISGQTVNTFVEPKYKRGEFRSDDAFNAAKGDAGKETGRKFVVNSISVDGKPLTGAEYYKALDKLKLEAGPRRDVEKPSYRSTKPDTFEERRQYIGNRNIDIDERLRYAEEMDDADFIEAVDEFTENFIREHTENGEYVVGNEAFFDKKLNEFIEQYEEGHDYSWVVDGEEVKQRDNKRNTVYVLEDDNFMSEFVNEAEESKAAREARIGRAPSYVMSRENIARDIQKEIEENVKAITDEDGKETDIDSGTFKLKLDGADSPYNMTATFVHPAGRSSETGHYIIEIFHNKAIADNDVRLTRFEIGTAEAAAKEAAETIYKYERGILDAKEAKIDMTRKEMAEELRGQVPAKNDYAGVYKLGPWELRVREYYKRGFLGGYSLEIFDGEERVWDRKATVKNGKLPDMVQRMASALHQLNYEDGTPHKFDILSKLNRQEYTADLNQALMPKERQEAKVYKDLDLRTFDSAFEPKVVEYNGKLYEVSQAYATKKGDTIQHVIYEVDANQKQVNDLEARVNIKAATSPEAAIKYALEHNMFKNITSDEGMAASAKERAKRGAKYGKEGNRNSDSAERDNGVGAPGGNSASNGDSGNAGRGQNETERALQKAARAGEKVSLADCFGDSGYSQDKSLTYVTEKDYTPGMRANAREVKRITGKDVRYVRGRWAKDIDPDGKSRIVARTSDSGEIVFNLDYYEYARSKGSKNSERAILLHESFHSLVKQNPGLLVFSRKALKDFYGEKTLERYATTYAEKIYGSAEKAQASISEDGEYPATVYEELCADAFGGTSRWGVDMRKAANSIRFEANRGLNAMKAKPELAAKLNEAARQKTENTNFEEDIGEDENADERPERPDWREVEEMRNRQEREEQPDRKYNEGPVHKVTDEEYAHKAFGKQYNAVQKAAENFANVKTFADEEAFQKSDTRQDKATRQKLSKLRELFSNAAKGSGNADTLFDFYESLADDSNLSNFYDEDVQRMIDHYRKVIDPNLDSYNEGAAPYAAANAMQMMAHRFAKAAEYQQTLTKMRETLLGTKSGVLRKIAKSDKLTANIAKALIRWQVNPDTVFKMIDAFDKGNAGEGYKLAKELQEAHRKKYAVKLAAQLRFSEVSKAKGFNDFVYGKQTVKDYNGKEWDMRSALGVIKAIDTIRSTSGKKLGGTNGFAVEDSKGNLDFIEMSDIDAIKLYDSLKKGLSEAAVKFGDAATEAYSDVKEDLRAKRKENDGLDIGMIGDADKIIGDKKGVKKAVYSPLSYANKNGDVFQFDIAKQDTYNNVPRMVQERSDDGGTYILIKPYTEVVDGYFEQVANYLAYSSFGNKIRGLGKSSKYTPGLGNTLAEVFGKDMGNWYKSYADDLLTYKNEDDVEGVNSLMRQGRQKLQQGALLFSVSVPMKQISSYWAASGILHPDSLIKNYRIKLLKPKNSSDAATMLASRAMGNLEQSAAEAARDAQQWLGKLKYSSKFIKMAANAINQMDFNTVSNLLSATEYDVLKYQFNNDKSKVGTEEYKAAVEQLFQDVVDRSQPNFDKQMRAEYGRTDNEVIRMLSMFRTQQTQNLNLLATAIGEYQAAKGTANQAKATETLKQTIAGQAASAFSLSVLTILADMLLHRQKKYEDDEKEIDPTKVLARLGINAAEAAAGTMWFGDTIAKWAIDKISGGKTKEFYGVNMGVISTVSDILENFEKFVQNPSRSNAKYCAGNIATLLGVPLNNAYAMLNSAIMYAKDVSGTNDGDYDDILKYLDAQSKAAKKEKEKAAKEAEKSGADILAEAAKQNSPESELNSAEEKNEAEVGGYLKKPYNALVEAGMSPERSQYVLDFIDTDDNDSIKQSEMWAFYKDNPDYEDYVIAMWNSYGYKTTWEAYKAKHK